MMPALLRDSPNYARCLCWFSADSVDARVATSDCCVITTKRLKISLCNTPATDYYDRFFGSGAYGPAHAAHMATWHP
jgi:hypothetical protein